MPNPYAEELDEMPRPTDTADPGTTAVGMHDAGPLNAEQEQAWTQDILAHAFDEDGNDDGFDLPPSYFEATGLEAQGTAS